MPVLKAWLESNNWEAADRKSFMQIDRFETMALTAQQELNSLSVPPWVALVDGLLSRTERERFACVNDTPGTGRSPLRVPVS